MPAIKNLGIFGYKEYTCLLTKIIIEVKNKNTENVI